MKKYVIKTSEYTRIGKSLISVASNICKANTDNKTLILF